MVHLRLSAFLLISALPVVSQAQTTAERREIAGIVKDATGAVVPKARVTLFSPGGTPAGTTSTGRDGTFRLSASKLTEGQLEIRRDGFKPYSLHVQISRDLKPITAVLQVADLSQHIDVTIPGEAGQVSAEPSENRDATVVNDNMLERLPVFDQDYIGAVSNFLDQGSSGNTGTTTVVDGMEQKDAGVTASAVQSVKINNDPYSAEFSRPGRGRIEITTKTPDPVYHGTFNAIIRDSHLDVRNAFASMRAPEQRRIFEGVLTGPVPQFGRTFFLLSADCRQDNLQSVGFAQLPSGAFTGKRAEPGSD